MDVIVCVSAVTEKHVILVFSLFVNLGAACIVSNAATTAHAAGAEQEMSNNLRMTRDDLTSHDGS